MQGHPILGFKLKRLRIQAGLTQEELAQAANCSDRLIRRAESSFPLRYDTLKRIASALSKKGASTSPDDLLSDHVSIAKRLWKGYGQYRQQLTDRFSHFEENLEWITAGATDAIPFAGHWRRLKQVRSGLELFFSWVHREPVVHPPLYLEGSRRVTIRSCERWHRIDNGAEIPNLWVSYHLSFRNGRIHRVEHHFDTLAVFRLCSHPPGF